MATRRDERSRAVHLVAEAYAVLEREEVNRGETDQNGMQRGHVDEPDPTGGLELSL